MPETKIMVYMTLQMRKRLEKTTERYGAKISSLVRKFIREGLDKYDN